MKRQFHNNVLRVHVFNAGTRHSTEMFHIFIQRISACTSVYKELWYKIKTS